MQFCISQMQNPQIDGSPLVIEYLTKLVYTEITERYSADIEFNYFGFRQHLKQVGQTGVAYLEPLD